MSRPTKEQQIEEALNALFSSITLEETMERVLKYERDVELYGEQFVRLLLPGERAKPIIGWSGEPV